jgi:acyl carrier protein
MTVQLEDRLRPLFITALDLPPEIDVDGLRYRYHPKWDSLAHMALVVTIEEAFDVELEADQLIAMDSLARAATILRELGVEG